MKRFFDDVEDRRRQLPAIRGDQGKFNQFYQSLQPLQQTFQSGVSGAGSLFAKTFRKTLDAEHLARYDAVVKERDLLRYRAKVGLAVAGLDRSVGLTAEQRRRLTELLLAETRPPRRAGQLDLQVVLYQLAHLDEAKVRPIFHEAQWNAVKQQLALVQRYEATLTRQGVLP
jgi:hypothetical protein